MHSSQIKLLPFNSKQTFHIVLNCEYWNDCFLLTYYFLQLFQKCCSYSVETALFKKLVLILPVSFSWEVVRVCYWRKWLKFRVLLHLKEKTCHFFTHVCFSHCYLIALDAAVSLTSNLWEGPRCVCSVFSGITAIVEII